ncbi:MAG: FHA domain-containing protein [Raineya sp.]|nr:FHA domain-containing protein [Raineya sp.]
MQTITIGRASNNDIVIQDSAVSRNHLKITKTAQGEYILEDLGSTNGTFVNGKPVRTCKLQANDVVKIGDTVLPWQNYFQKSYQSPQEIVTGTLVRKISIGRASSNDFVINEPTVSSQHAFLEIYDNGNLRIVDNGSTNGTFRQGQRIQAALVNSGEFIQFGSAKVNVSDILQKQPVTPAFQPPLQPPAPPPNPVNTKNTKPQWLSFAGVGIVALALIVFVLLKKTEKPTNSTTTQEQQTQTEKSNSEIQGEKVIEDKKEEPVIEKPNQTKPSQEEKNTKNSVADLVEIAENAVFLVITYENGISKGIGTGFFVSNAGLAVSNYHVFSPGNEWQIKLKNGNTYNVKRIIESNEDLDYIIFETDANEVASLPLAKENPRKGEDIIVIGNPQGFELSVTKGVVSGLRNYDKYTGFASDGDNYLQIDAPISSGNSGGPVLNLQGEVVGIATMVHHGSGGITQNINLALNIQKLPLPK